MSYDQAMRWNKAHPRGGKTQYMGFSTGSGFWPAEAWLKRVYFPYLKRCKKSGEIPLSAEEKYKEGLRKV